MNLCGKHGLHCFQYVALLCHGHGILPARQMHDDSEISKNGFVKLKRFRIISSEYAKFRKCYGKEHSTGGTVAVGKAYQQKNEVQSQGIFVCKQMYFS